jgi:probable rRNA maturation factor
MKQTIDIQNATAVKLPVSKKILREWAKITLNNTHERHELTLRFVDKEEIRTLNRTYRQQDKPTNVLAFPSAIPDEIKKIHPFLGDVIVCPEVLEEESINQKIPLIAHWAHIIIHGILHLLGHDHIHDEETEIMQNLEIKRLAELGFDNPYHTEDHSIE